MRGDALRDDEERRETATDVHGGGPVSPRKDCTEFLTLISHVGCGTARRSALKTRRRSQPRERSLLHQTTESMHQNYPPGWLEWTRLVRKRFRPKDLGFNCGFDGVNRFAHRYRLARSFSGVGLDGYAYTTVAGYSGLFGAFLMWSAFEQLLKITGTPQALYHPDDNAYPHDFGVEAVKVEDPTFRFYSMVAEKSNESAKKQLNAFMTGQPFNFTYLASTIRHIFAHGILTPTANKTRIGAVVAITSLVNDAHFMILDYEFGRRVFELVEGTNKGAEVVQLRKLTRPE